MFSGVSAGNIDDIVIFGDERRADSVTGVLFAVILTLAVFILIDK